MSTETPPETKQPEQQQQTDEELFAIESLKRIRSSISSMSQADRDAAFEKSILEDTILAERIRKQNEINEKKAIQEREIKVKNMIGNSGINVDEKTFKKIVEDPQLETIVSEMQQKTSQSISKQTEEMNQMKKEMELIKSQLAGEKRKFEEYSTDIEKQKQQKVEELSKKQDEVIDNAYSRIRAKQGLPPSKLFSSSNPRTEIISLSKDGVKDTSFVLEAWRNNRDKVRQMDDVDQYSRILHEKARKQQQLLRNNNL